MWPDGDVDAGTPAPERQRRMSADRLRHELLGAADRCCPAGLCVYRPELVSAYLAVLRDARQRGEDPTAARVLGRPGDSPSRGAGVSTSLDVRYVSRLWDVQRAIAEGAVGVDEVCRKLCPYGLDDAQSESA
jgi:hypothetical protein